MLSVLFIKAERTVNSSDGSIISSDSGNCYCALYDNDVIRDEERAIEMAKEEISGWRSTETLKYREHFILITEKQFINLLEGRLKNRDGK